MQQAIDIPIDIHNGKSQNHTGGFILVIMKCREIAQKRVAAPIYWKPEVLLHRPTVGNPSVGCCEKTRKTGISCAKD